MFEYLAAKKMFTLESLWRDTFLIIAKESQQNNFQIPERTWIVTGFDVHNQNPLTKTNNHLSLEINFSFEN